jgi:anti-anti-sigma regulatory factor
VSTRVLVAMISASGRVDADHAAGLEHELDASIDEGATRLLVDLSEADDVATASINRLLAARQRLFRREGRIAVVLSAKLRRRFRLLQLDRRFLVAADRVEAAELLGIAPTRSFGRARAA